MAEHIELDRRFWLAETADENSSESTRTMLALDVDRQVSWDDLLKKTRIVILAEPGTGKTEELRAVTKRLRNTGKSAFFCRIELLQDLDVRQSFDIGTSAEFENWLIGDQEGYFFLDSVDEARLHSHSAFEKALRRFAAAVEEPLNRAKIVVSCRVSEWRATADLSLFLTNLPIPKVITMQKTEETPTEEVDHVYKEATPDDATTDSKEKRDHIVFQLAPLNEQQIRRFASEKGVVNTNAFIEAIERADAMIFAERPQDLLELIAFWKANSRLGRHAEMLEFNIHIKLDEYDPERDRQRPLPADDARFGAERLAAAITLQKKAVIILPDRPIDSDLRESSIDPKEVLPDWPADKIQTLLDRAIFDEALYGTVRFHHRSVGEYLTARWLNRLLNEGMSRRSIEGLLFANRYGCDVVIPSMRPIAAWLAVWDERVRNRLRTIAPEVLIENGDPSALPVEFRKELLIGFAELYAEQQYTGTSFDITMVRRLADPRLALTVNDLLRRFENHNDICTLMLKLIWQGQMSESAGAAFSYAIDNEGSSYTRACAIRAVAAAGTSDQKHDLINALLSDLSKHDSSLLGEIVDAFFPDNLSVEQLLIISESADPPKEYSFSELKHSIETICKSPLSDEMAESLLQGLHILVKRPPFIERHHCEISQRYAWLLPSALSLANQFVQKRHPFSFDPIVLDLFLGFLVAQDYHHFTNSELEGILKEPKAWPEFRLQLFWQAVNAARARETDETKHLSGWWEVRWDIRDLWLPNFDDLERLFASVNEKPLMDDRLISLTAIFAVYVNKNRPRQLRERMKRIAAGTLELKTKLHEMLHPKPLSDEEKRQKRQRRNMEKGIDAIKKRQEAIRQDWRQELKKIPEEIKNAGNAHKGEISQVTAFLYDRIRENKRVSADRLGNPNWKVLIDEFGYEVAKNFRDSCVAYWREYDPFVYPNRRTDNSIPWARIIGLSGIAMEAADDSEWAKNISHDEAEIAAHYSVCELNGFPVWFMDLNNEFPDVVDSVIKDELRWEFHEQPIEKKHAHILSAIRHGNEDFRKRYKSFLFDLLSEKEPMDDHMLDHALSLILEGDLDTVFKKKVSDLASKQFKEATIYSHKSMWLVVLLCINGVEGTIMLKDWVNGLTSDEAQKETMISFCAALTDYGDARFGLRDYERVEVLRELLPFIFNFVKKEEDIKHEGVYNVDSRDFAERTRSRLLSIIFDTQGRPSYDALMNISTSIGDDYLKDRMRYLAKERAALDAEFEPWIGSSVAEFAISAEKEPRSEGDLYELALVRLDELKTDIEDGDESEAVILKKLTDETEIRIMIAGRLRKSSRSRYTVGSEEELADAKRTDIRLNAPQIAAPVPIELKIADNWSFSELSERLENQLIGQYMRVSQYGIFLVVHNGRQKHWKNFIDNKMLTFSELIETLRQTANNLTRKYSKIAGLEIFCIDFTAR